MVALTHHQAKKVEAGRALGPSYPSTISMSGRNAATADQNGSEDGTGLPSSVTDPAPTSRPDAIPGPSSADDTPGFQRTTSSPAFLQVVLVLPLQLLAYRIARLRGLNVDQPRNLAKTVTVE